MYGSVNTLAAVVPKAHAPAADTAAVITLAAASGTRHVLDQVLCGYSADPTAGSLTIALTVNATAVSIVVAITADDPVNVLFQQPLQGDDDTAITITLAAGGGAVVGKVNVLTR